MYHVVTESATKLTIPKHNEVTQKVVKMAFFHTFTARSIAAIAVDIYY